MTFKTINDLNQLINKNIHMIPSDVDLVVGIPRSGLFVATLISLYLNLPVTDVDSLLNDSIFSWNLIVSKLSVALISIAEYKNGTL